MNRATQLGAILLASLTLSSVTYAANPGAYVGLGLGGSRLDTPNQYAFAIENTNSRSLGGLGGRVFAGYNFSKYFGIEAGYNRYAASVYKGNLENGGPSSSNPSSSIKDTMSALDVVGKGYLPLGDSQFNLYALGGFARVNNTVKFNDGGLPLQNGFALPAGSHTTHKIRPIYGIGASYDITSHVTTNLEFTRIQGSGNFKTSAKAIPSANMATLNISYNFG